MRKEKLKVFEAFAGIGAVTKALRNIGLDTEITGISEIDKYASIAYQAVHGEVKNYGDIAKIDVEELPEIDLFTYGFPCQDISVAGQQQGLDKGSGTRSSLLWECKRIIDYKRPKYLLMENVKNLVGKRHLDNFNKWLKHLEELGYKNYWQVLNAKDYGIPQNRERVFCLSLRGDVDLGYKFPKPFDRGLRLKDFLLDEVEEKYYIDNERTEKLISQLQEKMPSMKHGGINVSRQGSELDSKADIASCLLARDYKGLGNQSMTAVIETGPKRLGGLYDTNKSRRQAGAVWDKEHISPTLDTMQGGYREPLVIDEFIVCEERKDEGLRNYKGDYVGTLRTIDSGGDKRVIEPKVVVKEATKKGYDIATLGDSINISFPSSKTRRGRVGKGVAQTLETACTQATLEHNYKIRKLTPQECWRLMGFTDEDYWKARKALEKEFYNGKDRSNSQMYKMAGNSIVVNVLEEIFKNLFKTGGTIDGQ